MGCAVPRVYQFREGNADLAKHRHQTNASIIVSWQAKYLQTDFVSLGISSVGVPETHCRKEGGYAPILVG